MRTEYIGAFQVPDGYFGDSVVIHLCFDPQTACCLEVSDTGYFRSCVPLATSKDEAEWLVKNHPVCKNQFRALS